MVERPIKKSERLAKAASGEGDSPEVSREPRSNDRGRGKGGKKGGRREKDEEPKQAANPALMRGPRPEKAKPPVEEPPVEETSTETEAEATSAETEPVEEGETQAVDQAESVEEP